jgi:hypothetical protein
MKYRIIELIKMLCKNSRFVGSTGSNTARKLITNFLSSCGYNYKYYKTKIIGWNIKENPVVEILQPKYLKLTTYPALYSEPTPKEGIEGYLVEDGYIKILETFDWEKYKVVDSNGKVIGYIISNEKDTRPQPIPFGELEAPCVIIDKKDLTIIKNWIKNKKKIKVKIYNPTIFYDEIEVVNIVTEKPFNVPYILICAHYDTVPFTVGAHDNASGVVGTLLLAELFSKEKICRFAFFDGEEINKVGSSAFVNEIRNELSEIKLVIELDAIGIGNEIVLLCSKKAYKKIKKCKSELEKVVPEGYKLHISAQSKISFSDVWSFMKEGIPAIRILTRNGNNIMHLKEDTPEKINAETILAVINIVKHLVKTY